MKNDRQKLAQKIGKKLVGNECTSFAMGVKWADYHPNWKEDMPKQSTYENGLPKLYLCQILTLDMTFGFRYSYRIGFINDKGQWNIDRDTFIKVVRYMDIFNDNDIYKDIEKYKDFFNTI